MQYSLAARERLGRVPNGKEALQSNRISPATTAHATCCTLCSSVRARAFRSRRASSRVQDTWTEIMPCACATSALGADPFPAYWLMGPPSLTQACSASQGLGLRYGTKIHRDRQFGAYLRWHVTTTRLVRFAASVTDSD